MTAVQRRIRIVSFDAGGTLIHTKRPVGEVYAEILRDVGEDAPAQEIDARFKAVFARQTRQLRPRTDEAAERAFWLEIVRESIEPWCPAVKLDNVFNRAFRAFATGENWRADTAAEEVLSTLRNRGLQIVVLSNSDSRFRRVLQDLGLLGYCKQVFLSSEIGYEKPDPRLFEHVVNELQAKPNEILHVGDSERHDGEGARQAGWSAAILGKDLKGLSDLPEFIDAISSAH